GSFYPKWGRLSSIRWYLYVSVWVFCLGRFRLGISGTVNLRSGKIPITWHRVTRHSLTAMESEAKAVSPR
ncbi:MAG: hypothetical protein AB2814_11110, partial [Candidatus Sedimenticola endophacoides]